ncbi:HdeD family acid-resistance protein [Amaricoccus tamworthensis]|uniref:HdeD family acid-resistance protein n=1 Tax=Amaricoccus tamworthensis TaxID=57002 RepID=UPI003C7CE012
MSISLNEASTVMREAVRNMLRRRSMLYLVQGGFLAFAGLLALIFPVFASTGILVLLGWMLILIAIFHGITLFGATQVPSFSIQMISAVLQFIVGFLFVANPEAGLITITLLMLLLFMIGGLSKIVFALMIRPMRDWTWILAGGVVAVFCSVILFANMPQASEWLLGFLLGVQLVAEGCAQAYMAWRIRKLSEQPAA